MKRIADVPSPSPYVSFETVDAIAGKLREEFGDAEDKLDIDRFLDWLEISLYYDSFPEPDGASFFAGFEAENGGTICINSNHEDLFDSRPDVYCHCASHEVGHAVLKHLDHPSLLPDTPLFDFDAAPSPRLHKSSWHQFGLSGDEVRRRKEEIESKRKEWVKDALVNQSARQALQEMDQRFEPVWMFRQAEHFARCVQVPRDALFARIEEVPLTPGWSPLYRLAERFGVSATTIKIRLQKLGLIEFDNRGRPYPVDRPEQTTLF